jgi:histidinol-phosphate aminotransferase
MDKEPNQILKSLIRSKISQIEEYSPITPVEVLSEKIHKPTGEILKLDGNENPYGCSPKVKQALSNYLYYHIYPDPEQSELREALSRFVSLDSRYIVAGSGSDELIDLILRLFIEPGDKVINCPPTFGMYPFSAEVNIAEVVNIPRDENFAIDVAQIKAAIDKRTKVVFIASPNNPSGNATPKEEIVSLLDSQVMVVVDEAYYEFSQGETVAPLVPHYDNLMVLRTFSKWAGLAGLRFGYGVFPAEVARLLMKIKLPYNINVAAQVAVLASLADLDYLQNTIKAIVVERQRLFRKLKEIKLFQPLPSEANFTLCQVAKAREIYQELRQRGIFIRYFDTPRLNDYLRISIGKPEQTEILIANLKALGDEYG